MKKLLNLSILIAVIFFATAATPASKATPKKPSTTVSFFIANGTNWYGYCQIGGSQITLNPTSGTTTQVSTGTYTITLHTDSPGSHQYSAGGPAVVSSTGTVTFYNVNISANTNAYIY